MATREENLKKINDELEKLDDEQLEKIAGGKIPPRSLLPHTNFSIADGNQDTNPAASLLGDTAGYRPKCMPKDSPR